MTKFGKIDTSDLSRLPEDHELATAQFFANYGKDIKFIKPCNIKGVHTPDFYMDGLAWEVKSPTGKNVQGIETNFRTATKQSENIIFDLRRSRVPENKSVRRIRRIAAKARGTKKVIVITKDEKVLTIKYK